jgi:drug/metabolite transporter (DMT)-like permease
MKILLLLFLIFVLSAHAFTTRVSVSKATKQSISPNQISKIQSILDNSSKSIQLTRLYETQIDTENESLLSPSNGIPDKILGILVLLTVPLSWGTYVPVVRYLYAIQPPVPGFVFSACYYALAAITTSSLVLWQMNKSQSSCDDDAQFEQSKNGDLPIIGGLELGSYLFIANCLQVVGLQTVESDRAGFLVQFTTVMVPFAEALFAGNLVTVSIRTWFACIFAFLGLFVMGLDGKADLAGDPLSSLVLAFSSFTKGDALILGAAVLYTMHVVRLGTYAKETTPMKLAASKATVESILSIILVIGLASLAPLVGQQNGLIGFGAETGKEIVSFFSIFGDGFASGNIPQSALFQAGGAVLWTGKALDFNRV